ncbi:DUF2127 domain-containing protein [Catelliglobosispora koreensis]|uniref:DUF2127 domain-containing protein n=1 Tax=Catelliglobosispora koreensis TaxID=129052 RepID=UPI00036FDF57|nr:DUF2127 domain-containing protein [Catelliglobosispora koreensis]
MDINLLACTRHHLTYAPDEPELRAHLHVETPAGEAWRCLRCGDFVPGAPRASGPAEEAPVPLRGKLLRDAIVLRLLAVDRLLKGTVVLLVAYGVFRYRAHADAVRRAFEADLPLLQPLADRLHWNLQDSSIVHAIRVVLETRPGTLGWITFFLVLYSVISLTEGVGLWLLKRWGEYVAAVATAFFIPVEIFELTHKVTWLRIAALIINVAAVAFLLYRKRLFGINGGRAAYEEEQHHESLMQVIKKAAG